MSITIGDNGHKLRFSDSSFYDFVCEYCGANDGYLSTLDDKCPGPRKNVTINQKAGSNHTDKGSRKSINDKLECKVE